MRDIRKTGHLQPTLLWFGTNGFQRRFYNDIKRIRQNVKHLQNKRIKINAKIKQSNG